jgi:hypothetical protein
MKDLIDWLRAEAVRHTESIAGKDPSVNAHVLKLREWANTLAAAPAVPAQSKESDKWVAKVRVTHKGYSMELSKYIAYALPEGIHDLYAAPQPAQTEPATDGQQLVRELREWAAQQKPLDVRSAKVLHDNLWDLYASDESARTSDAAQTDTATTTGDGANEGCRYVEPMTVDKMQELLAKKGYRYGKDATEQVLLGWELARSVFA